MSPLPSKGVVAGRADELAQPIGALLGGVEVGDERRSLFPQFPDARPSRGGGGRPRQGRVAGGEPLDLLQLDAVPGRIADHGVESALRTVVLPAAPHARKGGLPVQKALAAGD